MCHIVLLILRIWDEFLAVSNYIVTVFTLNCVWQVVGMKKSVTTIFLLFSCDFIISASLFHRSLQKVF